jgi:hypothetical protein
LARIWRHGDARYQSGKADDIASAYLDVVNLSCCDDIAAFAASRLNSAPHGGYGNGLGGVANLQIDVAHGACFRRGENYALSRGQFEAWRFHGELVLAGRDTTEMRSHAIVGGGGASNARRCEGGRDLAASNWQAGRVPNRPDD